MAFQETIQLRFKHNLILGHCPEIVDLAKVSEILKEKSSASVEKFGLFEVAAPNYNTYYPDVKAEDLTPKNDEFAEPVFRALSETIVHKSWNPVDFSMNSVLKKSTPLLLGQSLYIDHEAAVGNTVGVISQVSWQESYKADGVTVPAGINARTKIDGKSNPKIVRGIMMDPPSIHSTSVTVQFLWEKSHSELSVDDFYRKIGTRDKDGSLIRKIATNIQAYHEMSFVGHGADTFAQKVGSDGKIVNPGYAGVMANSEQKKKSHIFMFDYKQDVTSNSEHTIPDDLNDNESGSNTEHLNQTNMEFLQLMASILGLATTATQQEVETKLREVLTNSQTATTNLTAKTTEVTNLTAKVTGLESFQTKVLTDLRTETNRLYTVSCGAGTPAPAIVEMINQATYESLQALHTQYKTLADQAAPLSCKSCGSTEINRASSTQNPNPGEGGGNPGESPKGEKSMSQVLEEARNKRRDSALSAMHGEKGGDKK